MSIWSMSSRDIYHKYFSEHFQRGRNSRPYGAARLSPSLRRDIAHALAVAAMVLVVLLAWLIPHEPPACGLQPHEALIDAQAYRAGCAP